MALGESDAAQELGKKTLYRCLQELGSDHPVTIKAASNLAMVVLARGDHQAALNLLEGTLPRLRRVHGENHPHAKVMAEILARIAPTLGKTD